MLKGELSKKLSDVHLSEADPARINAPVFYGTLHGENYRPIIAPPLSLKPYERTYWVYFLVDSGSPETTISEDVFKTITARNEFGKTFGKIAGHETIINQSHSHFADLNLLGSDFLGKTGGWVDLRYKKRKL